MKKIARDFPSNQLPFGSQISGVFGRFSGDQICLSLPSHVNSYKAATCHENDQRRAVEHNERSHIPPGAHEIISSTSMAGNRKKGSSKQGEPLRML